MVVRKHNNKFLLCTFGFLVACSNEGQSSDIELAETQSPAVQVDVASPEPAANVYAFSMLAPHNNGGNIIYARVVIDSPNQACPILKGDDNSVLTTSVRRLNPTSSGLQVKPENFPVTVCEAVMREGVSYTNSAVGVSLDKVTLDVKQVQVYGDSGCKIDDCPSGTPSTEFKALSDKGATQSVDLILHMGDFNYRGTSAHFATLNGEKIYAYDAGDTPNPQPSCSYYGDYYSQNAGDSPKPDEWSYWRDDFFTSATSLLPKAPWVFARGNHELCSRAGAGWFYFLGPGSSLAGSRQSQMQCPDQGQSLDSPPKSAAGRVQMIEPYMVSLSNFQVWVTDSANACDDFSQTPLTAQYQTQFETLASSASVIANTPTWVMGHRPIWGYQGGSGSINNMLQTALNNTKAGALPSAVQLSLAGHMHIYESLTFFDSSKQPTGRPPQIVIGNSGVALGGAPGNGSQDNIDAQAAEYNSALSFGFLQMTVGDQGVWQGQVIEANDDLIAQCDSKNPSKQKPICQ